MAKQTSKRTSLIICTPYDEPTHHFPTSSATSTRKTLVKSEGRRPAGVALQRPLDDTNTAFSNPLPAVQAIRPLVKKWRMDGYPGATSTTRDLLEYWFDPTREQRLFFCQQEAIETLIWLTEGAEADRKTLPIEGDGGDFTRYCCKMATGTGKTMVMAMVIAWQTMNKMAYPNDGRFTKHFLVIAPNLTVRDRLDDLLIENHQRLQGTGLTLFSSRWFKSLTSANITIVNWQALAWESDKDLQKSRGVDKRSRMPRSDLAWLKQKLPKLAEAQNIMVLNDEAHHANQAQPDQCVRGR